MKTLELDKDSIKLITQCLQQRIDYLYDTNMVYTDMRKKGIWGDEVVKSYNENVTKINKIKTLIDYLNS